MLRRTPILLLALSVAALWLPAAGGAAQADRAGISVAPGNVVQAAKPGSSFTLRFDVANSTDAAAQLTTNAVQARGAANGESLVQIDARATDDPSRNASTWLTFPERRFTLAPGERRSVEIRVRVPRGARPGVHGAIVMFNVPTTRPGTGGAGVQGTAGLGASVLLEVPGDAAASARIVSSHGPSIVRSGGSGTFRARVENTGDTLLRLDGELRLDSVVGASRLIGAEEQLALPGGQRTFRFRYEDPPLLGRYTPQLTVVGGTGSDVRIETDLDAVWVLPPWWLVAAFAAAVVLAIAGARLRARRA